MMAAPSCAGVQGTTLLNVSITPVTPMKSAVTIMVFQAAILLVKATVVKQCLQFTLFVCVLFLLT